jgi:hypothetical protein
MTITERLIQAGNYTPGRDGQRIQWLILHTEDGNDGSSWNVFNDPSKQRSAHYLVGENGEIIHAVADGDTAWHAANWPVNQGSIGIEHEDLGNYNDAIRTDAEYASSAWLVAEKCRTFGIPCVKVETDSNHMPLGPGILVHKNVSRSGTACPDGLDWERIIRQAQAILGGVSPTPPVLADAPDVTVLNQAITVNWQNLQVRGDASTGAQGNLANTPDGLLHAGNVITITGWKHGESVTQNSITTDVWLRTVWGHWIFAGGTNFPFAQFTSPAAAPTSSEQATVSPETPVVAAPESTLPSGISDWTEEHEIVFTTIPGMSVDVLGTGAPQVGFPAGQRIEKSGTFMHDNKTYIRTEYGLTKGTWNGIPVATTIAESAPLPDGASAIPTSVVSSPKPASPAITNTTVDGIAPPANPATSVSTVQKRPGLTVRQQLIAAIAALASFGVDFGTTFASIFHRPKK